MPPLDRPIQVLLVEDDEVDIQSVQRAFKKLDFEIRLHVARDGAEALQMLHHPYEKTKSIPIPQLIILDISMPKMNGIDFLREIRNNPEFDLTNVLIFTTSNDQQDKISALSLNISGYLLKPLQPEEFIPLCQILLEPVA